MPSEHAQESIRAVSAEWEATCRARINGTDPYAVIEWCENNRSLDSSRGGCSRGYVEVDDAHLNVFGRPPDGLDRVVNGVVSVHVQLVSVRARERQ